MNTIKYEMDGAIAIITYPNGHEMMINAVEEPHLINKFADFCPLCEKNNTVPIEKTLSAGVDNSNQA